MGTARAPRGDTPYLGRGAGASRRGRLCSGGRRCRQWGTHSARGSGRRRWHGDSSASCQRSTRPAGASRTRHSDGHARSPLNVPLSPHPIPGAWGSTPRRRCLSHSTWHHWDTRTGHRGRGQHGALRRQVRDPRVHPVPSRPTPVPQPPSRVPVPRSVTQDSPSALQWDPRGQQWWPPTQGTLWGERRGSEGRGVRECPPNGRERGETEDRGGGSPLAAGSWRGRMSCPGTPLHCGQAGPGGAQEGLSSPVEVPPTPPNPVHSPG